MLEPWAQLDRCAVAQRGKHPAQCQKRLTTGWILASPGKRSGLRCSLDCASPRSNDWNLDWSLGLRHPFGIRHSDFVISYDDFHFNFLKGKLVVNQPQ